MISDSMDQFLQTMLRMKKGTACFPNTVRLQYSEIAVMYRAFVGCPLDRKGFTVSEIQQSLHISKPAVSQTLNSLEKKGYIVRSIDSGDRRKITVTLTGNGKVELDDAMECQNRILTKVFEEFGEESIMQFTQLANRLMDILEGISDDEQNERCE